MRCFVEGRRAPRPQSAIFRVSEDVRRQFRVSCSDFKAFLGMFPLRPTVLHRDFIRGY